MTRTTILRAVTMLAAALASSPDESMAQSARYTFERPAGTADAILRIALPNGRVVEQRFAAGTAPSIGVTLGDGTVLADGTHKWEISYAPVVGVAQRASAQARRANGDDTLPPGWPAAREASRGLFLVRNGQFVPMLADEPDAGGPKVEPTGTSVLQGGGTAAAPGPVPKDQLIPDDLIVQGSLCAGFDCVNNETFGFDTVRLKENNTRIAFQDTSTGTFPTIDWELTANDSLSGALNRFSIQDTTNSRIPFTIEANAPTDSLRIVASGRIGLRTATPAQDLHIATGNTPAIRLDQSGAGGFTPQVWDVAGNEANFFVRDVTSGNLFPFRIRPGAPTSSLDISADGDIGMGIDAPTARLDLRANANPAEPWLRVAVGGLGTPADADVRLQLDPAGNLYVGGSITQLSSRTSKTNLVEVAGTEILDRLAALPLYTWNYLSADFADRHIGPVAEDFHAAFGFGRDARSLAPADVAGVALAATQALQAEVAARDRRIEELEARLARLEAALEANAAAPR